MAAIILFLISLHFTVPNILVKLYHRDIYTTKVTASMYTAQCCAWSALCTWGLGRSSEKGGITNFVFFWI